eukprot:COSAG01_NODE_50459_length_363_cov_0.897727_1_plen_29_part_01
MRLALLFLALGRMGCRLSCIQQGQYISI